jgi:alkanesulfonate monooxygenase SsuD/methylene tetrahydromethanopterin reductase-like flavin-dependent oxidoreductase (luciferase family)
VTQSKPVVTETTFSGSPEEVVDQIEDFFDGQTGPGMKEAGEALKKLLSGKTGE